LVKISVNRYVLQRIEKIRKDVEANTQRLRGKTRNYLEEIFIMAAKIARGKIKHQRINGKMVPITLNQRRRWLQVAAHAAETIKSVATNFDEQEIHTKLKELERIVDETKTRKRTKNSRNES
jgi:methionyl-tRNA synthetase